MQYFGDAIDDLGEPAQQLGQRARLERGQVLDHLHERHAAFVQHCVVEPLSGLDQAHSPDGDALAHQPRQFAGIDVNREQRVSVRSAALRASTTASNAAVRSFSGTRLKVVPNADPH